MKKKAEAISQVFTFIVAILLIGIVVLFGYNAFIKMKDKQCKSELVSFTDDLKTSIEDVSRREGATVDKSYTFSCEVNKFYFVDRAKPITKQTINDNPIINDSIYSSVKDNMFVMRKDEVFYTDYMGAITIVQPNFICLVPNGNQIEITLQGKEGKTVMQPKSARYSCGPTLIQPMVNVTALNAAFDQIKSSTDTFGTPVFATPHALEDAEKKYESTRDYVDITREIIKQKDGSTDVRIKITPKPGIKLDQFTYFEQISKECILKLTGGLRSNFQYFEISGDYDDLNMDPLLMWHLHNSDIHDTQQLNYTIIPSGQLNSHFDDFCKELLTGMGYSNIVTSIV